jgi:hypothetical protein
VAERTTDDDLPGLTDLLDTLREQGFAAPDLDAEVTDPHTGAPILVAVASWPQGLQEEMGDPVVLVPETTPEEQVALEASDFRVFHSVQALSRYVDNLHAGQAA